MNGKSKFVVLLLCAACFVGGAYSKNVGQEKLLASVKADAREYSSFANITPEPTQIPTAQSTATRKPPRTPTPKPAATATPKATRTATPKPTKTPRPIRTVKPAQLPTAIKQSTETKIAAWVAGESANVRTGSATSYKVVEKLYYGDKLYVIDKTFHNGWCKVKTLSGNTGYVSAKLLSATQPTVHSSHSNNSANSQQQSQTVYVSRTGECYHSYAGCSDMINPITMTEDEAIARGRRRCRKCW